MSAFAELCCCFFSSLCSLCFRACRTKYHANDVESNRASDGSESTPILSKKGTYVSPDYEGQICEQNLAPVVFMASQMNERIKTETSKRDAEPDSEKSQSSGATNDPILQKEDTEENKRKLHLKDIFMKAMSNRELFIEDQTIGPIDNLKNFWEKGNVTGSGKRSRAEADDLSASSSVASQQHNRPSSASEGDENEEPFTKHARKRGSVAALVSVWQKKAEVI